MLVAVVPLLAVPNHEIVNTLTAGGHKSGAAEMANAFRSRIHGTGDQITIFGEKKEALREHHVTAQSEQWAKNIVSSMIPSNSTRVHAAQVHAQYDLSANYIGREQMGAIDLAVEPSAAQPWHRLLVYIDSIRGVSNSFDFWDRPDPFVQATITSNDVHSLTNSWRTLVNPSNVLDYAFNEKGMLLFRPGLTSVEISAWDSDTVTSNDLIVRSNLPIPSFSDSAPSEWVNHTINNGNCQLHVRLRVLPWAFKMQSQAQQTRMQARVTDTVLLPTAPAVMSTVLTPGNTKALVWFIGRGDAMFHPHVVNMFTSFGYDIYTVNYRMNGACRKHGLYTNPLHTSHCASEDFSEYDPEITYILNQVAAGSYSTVIGYGHSTGAPVMLNYVINHGDAAFTGFIFNSPFLDWGHQGANELILSNPATCLAPASMALSGGGGPSGWALPIWSQYEFEPALRGTYNTAVTVGFVCGASRAQAAVQAQNPVTSKPFFVITATGDDTLEHQESLSFSTAIGPARTVSLIQNSRHDVFLAMEPETLGFALEATCAYMVSQGWASSNCAGGAATWIA